MIEPAIAAAIVTASKTGYIRESGRRAQKPRRQGDTPMIEPAIAAAIVTASGTLIGKLLELAGNREPTDKAREVIDKTYDQLSKHAVTTNCVRILIALRQAGSKQSEGMLYPIVEAMRQRQEPNSLPFEANLTYRLRFLCLLGLVQPTLGEYALTQLGAAFLVRASEDTVNYRSAFVA